jgi:exopolyphosphatase/guanosine-5'-triphosphate,3'-diphosphate pyrophosphatase
MTALSELDRAIGDIDVFNAGEAVALGASATNLVTVRDQIAVWTPERVHGATLLYEEVGQMVGRLSDLTDEGRGALVGLEKGRERTIHIGALILERALFALKLGRCRVSVRGWRHALLEEESH